MSRIKSVERWTFNLGLGTTKLALLFNYPPTGLIFRIDVDMAGVGGVDRAIGEEGAGDDGIAGEQGAVGDQGALGDEGVVDAGA